MKKEWVHSESPRQRRGLRLSICSAVDDAGGPGVEVFGHAGAGGQDLVENPDFQVGVGAVGFDEVGDVLGFFGVDGAVGVGVVTDSTADQVFEVGVEAAVVSQVEEDSDLLGTDGAVGVDLVLELGHFVRVDATVGLDLVGEVDEAAAGQGQEGCDGGHVLSVLRGEEVLMATSLKKRRYAPLLIFLL